MEKKKLLLTIFSPILSLMVVGTLVGCNNSNNNNSNSSETSEQISSVEVSNDGTSLEEALIVSFVSNGGTNYYDVEYYGGIINLPIPEREDYNFLGWYDNENYTGDVYEGYLVPETNMTLYASWEEIDYPIVSFVTNSDNTSIDPIKYKGESIQIANPHKYGYEFTGWYTSSTFDEGTKVNLEELAPTEDITLYANYKEVVYIHYYYGQYSDYKYVGYDQGTTVEVEDLYNPGPMFIEGIECPFTGWTYEDGTPVGNTVVVDEEVILIAQYNRKNAPMKHFLTEYEKGILTSTGNVAYEHVKHNGVAYFEVNMMLTKGASGGCGVAWRMDLSGNDYPYQDVGTTYLSAVLVPASGALQIASVTNGAFKHMSGSVYPFEKLPASWQEKFNSETQIFVTIGVEDGGDYFNIYIDGELAFKYTDSAFLSNYKGTGFGIRCSSKGTDFKNFELKELTTVNYVSNGGTECSPTKYVIGSIDLPYTEKANSALEGWYYDEALTNKVDPNNFIVSSSNMTLYAKWTNNYYTVQLDTNGGSELGSIRYNNGKIVIVDVPTKDNYIFTGWYYDSNCTQPVDMDNPIINSNTTIYAGWDLPKGYVEKNGDGSYSITGKTAALHGISDSDGYIVEMEVSFTKGSSGAVGLMFNGSISADYNIETGQKYLSVQIIPASGGIQISHINNGFAHLSTSKSKLTSLPQAWQDKFNSASEGATVKGTLKVVVSDDCFRAYLDNELIFTTTEDQMETIKPYTGNGYGIRSSVPAGTATYKISCKEYSAESLDVIRVTLKSNDSTINRYTEKGGTIPLFEKVGSSSTLPNGNAETISYNWKNGNVIVDSNTTYSEHTVLVSTESNIITRGSLWTVTEDSNGYVYTSSSSVASTFTPTSLPDVSLNKGTLEMDITYTKTTVNAYHFVNILSNADKNVANFSSKSGVGSINIRWNTITGTLAFGWQMGNGTSIDTPSTTYQLAGGVFNNATFMSTYPELANKVTNPSKLATAVAIGEEVTLRVKVVIEEQGFKFYLDNCLLATYGIVSTVEGESALYSVTAEKLASSISGKKANTVQYDGITNYSTWGGVFNEFFQDAIANGYDTIGIAKRTQGGVGWTGTCDYSYSNITVTPNK